MRETIIQFGEGNFLRAFVDYYVDVLNKQGLYDGKVVVVQPRSGGRVEELNKQNGKYNLFIRGIENGEIIDRHHVIESITRGIDPYRNFALYMDLAGNEDLRFIVSNTTEAGIEFDPSNHFDDRPAKSFPGKLTQLLHERFRLNLPGFIFLPCELIDNNAEALKACILAYAEHWDLGDDFASWIHEENTFCNTLVDRITTGYPKDQLAEFESRIAFADSSIDVAEAFNLWVIEGNYESELPLQRAGLNVIWTDDVRPYKKRKVRILNGGHTAMVPGAMLHGLETVGECMGDPLVRSYLEHVMFQEIVPALGGKGEDSQFARDILERFENPFVQHRLSSIALNSVAKFTARVLPTILDYKEMFGVYPEGLTLSLAALIAFYRTDAVNDSPAVERFMREASVEDILKHQAYWQQDISDMAPLVNRYYAIIRGEGMKAAYEAVPGSKG